jgi:palmitoyltransferase ZDHHC9/14/18
LWKRDKQDSSQCYCDPEDACGEACHNRIMAYECDDTNCRLGADVCGNRPFAELKRRAKGNRYDYGVEVMDTPNRGFGVRAMRMFEPHQIIVEYAGEIITQSECERRMKQVYKKDKVSWLFLANSNHGFAHTITVLLPDELRQQDDYRCHPRHHRPFCQSFV